MGMGQGITFLEFNIVFKYFQLALNVPRHGNDIIMKPCYRNPKLKVTFICFNLLKIFSLATMSKDFIFKSINKFNRLVLLL